MHKKFRKGVVYSMKLNDFYAGQKVMSGQIGAILSKVTPSVTKTGKPYYDCEFQDSSTKIQVKIWDITPEIKEICEEFLAILKRQNDLKILNTPEALEELRMIPPIIVTFTGVVSEYSGKLQLTVTAMQKIKADPLDYFFAPVSTEMAQQYKEELSRYIAQVENEDCANILRLVLNDPIVARDFYLFPAAVGHHHAFKYGLLLHTLQVVKYAVALFDAYPIEHQKINVSRDIIITAAILHDLGKIEEYSYFISNNTIEYNQFGVHHRSSSLSLVREILAEHGLRNKYREICNKLGKVIYEHHGPYESERDYEKTKCLESKFIFAADATSAALAPFFEDPNNI